MALSFLLVSQVGIYVCLGACCGGVCEGRGGGREGGEGEREKGAKVEGGNGARGKREE